MPNRNTGGNMKDNEPLTPEWVGENMKLIHYLLKKRNICDSWTPDYEDIVQNVVLTILKNIPKYKPEVASKSTYIELLVMQEVCRPLRANIKLANSTEQLESWHDMEFECEMETQIYAEREFNKLTEVQQMEALGYTFREIGEVVGLSPDYIRNKKGLATRGKV
jgi:DNA-directed RNA polymerase specialized sigma subunit